MASINVLCLAFLTLFIGGALSSPHHTADHSNHCHATGDSGIIHIEVGDSASLPGKCQKVTCNKDFTLSALTCPAFVSAPGCKQSEIDYSKPYPECCPHDICGKKY